MAYSRAHGVRALIVARGAEVIAREYADGFAADSAHALYSGTKAFWGVAAVHACDEELIGLDDPIAQTIENWQDDPWKRLVTPRMLLSLTSGHGFGGLGAGVPNYVRALATPLRYEPGTRFIYGGIPFQVFAAFLARKLAAQHLTPLEYLQDRVLGPAAVTIANWRKLSDGSYPAPTGATLCAEDWLRYGRYVLDRRAALSICFHGSPNARYGLGWWLGAAGAPADLAYASGSGGQALYVIPSLDLVIVRFGKSASYRHATFLKRLFGGFVPGGAGGGSGILPKP